MSVEWRMMICDRPGCSKQLVGRARHDEDAIARLHQLAAANDWQVDPHHLCPEHARAGSSR